VNRLREEGFDVTAFWYNPNIHPFTEHQNRLKALETLAEVMGLPLIVSEGYEMIDYFRAVVAKERGFDAFTTTLHISPYQKHELLREVGEEVAREQGIDFYYEDFRPGFRESHRRSRELNLYHQKYCGCVYSEWERFGKVDIAKIVGSG